MQSKKIILGILLLFFFKSFSQKTNSPILLKVGDTWKIKIEQNNIGGILSSAGTVSNKSAQIKVLKVTPNGYPGYVLEWKYTDYSTFDTDTLEDECAILFKNFLLQTPIPVQIAETGKYQDWIDKAAMKTKFTTFYSKAANKSCLSNANDQIQMAGRFAAYFDALTPEIKTYFSAYSLFPLENDKKIDTVEVFNDYVYDSQKVIKLPKTISFTSKTTENEILVNFSSKISEPDYKKYFTESTNLAWDKHGLKKEDNVRIGLTKQLNDFQPKNSDSMVAKFDKKNGIINFFEYVKEEWGMLKGGETVIYKFTKL